MTNDTEITTAPAQKRSRWEDLVDALFAPADLFAQRAGESWGKPFLMLCVISVALYYVFLPVNSIMMQAAMTENARGGATPEQIQKGAQFMKYLGGIFLPFGFLYLTAVTAVALKLVSSLIEPAASWRQAFLIATYSLFITIPQQILSALLIFIKSRSGTVAMRDASFGVLHFMNKQDPVMSALLGRLDLFAFWSAAICAVGLIVVAHMPRARAFASAAIVWLAIALPGLAIAALFGNKGR